MTSPLVAEALEIAREHAKWSAYRWQPGLNRVMREIGLSGLAKGRWDEWPIRLAALAAAWLALPAAYRK